MAEVVAKFKLMDEMTDTLKHITKQLELLKTTESQTQQETKKVSNGFKLLGVELNGIVGKGLNAVSQKITNMTGSFKALDIAMGGIIANVVTKVAGMAGNLISSGIEFNKSMENYTTNFTTMLGGNVDLAKEKVAELKDFAAKTPFSMADLAQGTQTLLAFGIESEKTTDVLRMLGDVALGNAESFSSMTRVFGQVSASGKVTMEDINQLITAGFNPLEIISKKTGMGMSELRNEVSKGNISFEMLSETFKTATSAGGQFFNGMENASKTFSGVLSTMNDNVSSLLGTIMQPLTAVMKFLAESVIWVIGIIQPIIEGFYNWFVTNADAIILVLTVLGIAAVAFGVYWTISWMMANIATVITVSKWIAGFLIVIGIIYLVIEILSMFGINVNTVLGFVCGVFMWAVAIINNILYGLVVAIRMVLIIFKNVFFGIMEVVLGWASNIWNTFVDIANFILNVFRSPVTSVIRLFEGLANNVLNVLKSIAKGLDWVFGSNLAGTIEGWQAGITNKANELIDKYAKDEEYEEKFKKIDSTEILAGLGFERTDMSDAWNIDGWEMMNPGEAFNSGFEFGENLIGNIGGMLDGFGGGAGSAVNPADIGGGANALGGMNLGEGMANMADGIGKTNKGIDGVNDKLSGSGSLKSVGETQIVDDNLEYLKDIANMRYQQEYQKNPPQINVNFTTGDIKNGTDEKKLFAKFENTLLTALENNLSAS